ncbi:MAG TPA: transglutaminase family protein [Acidimicrobiales bacterium]|nr:transglutaminase family protein [Acidimicrobiales bacterium]
MRIRVGCEFEYEAAGPAPSVWQVRPRPDGAHRVLTERWEPPAPSRRFLDGFGNVGDRLTLPEGASTVRYDAVVEVPGTFDAADKEAGHMPVEELPDDALAYLLPSRFCWPDVLHDEAWELFGDVPPGWARVQAVSDWVHENIDYQMGSSTPLTTAKDIFDSRTGVCRDMTQLGISLCRALNVPARYVSGYLPDIAVEPPDLPMDFCSWLEAYLEGTWFTLDPRNNEPRIGRVVIARGRDAADTAMVTTWGSAVLNRMAVWADEASDESDEEADG